MAHGAFMPARPARPLGAAGCTPYYRQRAIARLLKTDLLHRQS